MQKAIPYRSARTWFSPPPINAAPRVAVAGIPPPPIDGSSTSPTPSSSSSSSSSGSSFGGGELGGIRQMVAENPVIVLARKGCCMCHVARRLLLGLGVNPAVYEFGEESASEAAVMIEEAAEIEVAGRELQRPMILPVVFVGGRLLGGLDRLVAVHITGELVPILKEAGGLWL
ncbi:monothiol glutaredoxin-S9-like [Canna indica]|uniref:Monothiol glutaredoxin-S9-like n=1 Tax=Canna indica TaxID=4628 RepID=A0AAQ3QJ25_9LILI|nr:monothiol glutaredoxin-S9-like [Canna indica]